MNIKYKEHKLYLNGEGDIRFEKKSVDFETSENHFAYTRTTRDTDAQYAINGKIKERPIGDFE